MIGKIAERFTALTPYFPPIITHSNHSCGLLQVIILGLSFKESSDGMGKRDIDRQVAMKKPTGKLNIRCVIDSLE